jgi:hypothetical protein
MTKPPPDVFSTSLIPLGFYHKLQKWANPDMQGAISRLVCYDVVQTTVESVRQG